MEQEIVKAVYEEPAIEEHGDVKSITLHGGSTWSDVPIGAPVSGTDS